jgi:crotonobetainyl-CoA:carnitine CoA-transferase CaiB-like acyl-CoA transferase
MSSKGPLAGIRILELAGLGPAPMCAMLLADLGATVLRLEREGDSELGVRRPRQFDLLLRGRHSIRLDLKSERGRAAALRLVESADGLIEGFRPGVMERLGLGPDDCLARNPRLVYGRMTGWGQTGPLAQSAGHDINYIAVTGALHAIGREGEPPAVPLNLVGDYGGGALYLALGLLAGLIEARGSGQGQVVDAAIVDGTASLLTSFYGLLNAGIWNETRGTNFADGGAPFYDTYLCSDGGRVAVGPIERKFLVRLLELLGLDAALAAATGDPARREALRHALASRFATEPRAHWQGLFDGTDACVSPVLSMSEAPAHPHLRSRQTFVSIDGIVQPAPAPRFSRTPTATPHGPREPGPSTRSAALHGWLPAADVERFFG